MAEGLARGPLEHAVYVCVDMQRLFAEDTEWHTPWMRRVLPHVVRLAGARPADTIFTRFIPAARPGEGSRHVEAVSRALGQRDAGAARTGDGRSPAGARGLRAAGRGGGQGGVLTLAHAAPAGQPAATGRPGGDRLGGETDVCVLATVLGAVDRGYRVVVASDCLCSSSDETHDALLAVYKSRYGQQVEVADTNELYDAWR